LRSRIPASGCPPRLNAKPLRPPARPLPVRRADQAAPRRDRRCGRRAFEPALCRQLARGRRCRAVSAARARRAAARLAQPAAAERLWQRRADARYCPRSQAHNLGGHAELPEAMTAGEIGRPLTDAPCKYNETLWLAVWRIAAGG
jgi:hypothetical protein